MPAAAHRVSDPVPIRPDLAQYLELLRLAAEGWTVPLSVGGRVVCYVAPGEPGKGERDGRGRK